MSSSSDDSTMEQPSALPAEEFARAMVWLLRAQALLAALAAVGLALWLGRAAALAGLGGGGIGIVLTAVAALRIVLSGNHATPAQLVAAFYRGMAIKLVLAALLFAAVAYWFAGFFVPVIVGYLATLVAYWLALWRLRGSLVSTN